MLAIAAQPVKDLVRVLGRDPDHRPHGVGQGDAGTSSVTAAESAHWVSCRYSSGLRSRVIRTGFDRIAVRPAGRASGFAAPGRGGGHLRLPLLPLRGHVRTEQSGAQRSMRSWATWRHTSRPTAGIGMPKLWA